MQVGEVWRKLLKGFLIFFAGIVLLGINVYFAPILWGLKLFLIPSDSMLPTLIPGDVVLVDLRAYHTNLPTEGDIVVFVDHTLNEGRALIKRVVRIDDYCDEGTACDSGRPYALFVEGDNASRSYDSRYFGSVGADQLIGKAIAIAGTINTDGVPGFQRMRRL